MSDAILDTYADFLKQKIKMANDALDKSIAELEDQIDEVKDPFVRKGLQLLVDGISAEKIRNVLEVDLRTYEQCHVTHLPAEPSPRD